MIACGKRREPVVSDTHTHVCFSSTKSGVTVPVCEDAHMCVANACAARIWAHVISHTCTWPRREPGIIVCARAHLCCRSKASGCLVARAAFVMFGCVTSNRCVLQACADMRFAAGGAVVTWLRVVSSHASTHTHTRTCTHLWSKQRTHRSWSVTARTHMCLHEARNLWPRFQLPGLCFDWRGVQPPVC